MVRAASKYENSVRSCWWLTWRSQCTCSCTAERQAVSQANLPLWRLPLLQFRKKRLSHSQPNPPCIRKIYLASKKLDQHFHGSGKSNVQIAKINCNRQYVLENIRLAFLLRKSKQKMKQISRHLIKTCFENRKIINRKKKKGENSVYVTFTCKLMLVLVRSNLVSPPEKCYREGKIPFFPIQENRGSWSVHSIFVI